MAQSIFHAKPHADVLKRVFDFSRHGMSCELAESILKLDFPDNDAARIEELNSKANDGTLTAEEKTELETYIEIGDLLAYWQSKARQTLQRPL